MLNSILLKNMHSLHVQFESIVVEINSWSLNQIFHSRSFQLILQVIYVYIFLPVVQIPDYRQCIFSDKHLNFVALVKSFNFLLWRVCIKCEPASHASHAVHWRIIEKDTIKIENSNTEKVVTRMDTPKSDCHLRSTYLIGVL